MEQFAQHTEGAGERAKLRKQVIATRATIPAAQRAHISSEICKQLLASLEISLALHSGTKPFVVGVYSAFPEEVQLHDFIVGAYARDVRVAFPCMMRDARSTNEVGQQMEMRAVEPDAYGAGGVTFLESPLARFNHDDEALVLYPYVPATELDMLVVPLVAFDASNNRLGYGGGNYDRYLTQLTPECRVVGVAFAEQQVERVPAESHDIPLPAIIAL